MSDNIGGIISAEYIFVEQVKTCAIIDQEICLNFTSGKNWKEFPATANKIQVTVVPTSENGITSYTINAILFCPKPKLDKYAEMASLQMHKILLKYATANGEILVVGDKAHPLKVTTEKLTPSEANGYSGTKFTITGINTHPALSLRTL